MIGVVCRFLIVSSSYFHIYVSSTLDTLFRTRCSRNYSGPSLHDTHNMVFHVQWKACLYKTTDSARDQWARAAAMPSRSPWKPVAWSQSEEARGGVWIEVARRARWFANSREPGRAGEELSATVSASPSEPSPIEEYWML